MKTPNQVPTSIFDSAIAAQELLQNENDFDAIVYPIEVYSSGTEQEKHDVLQELSSHFLLHPGDIDRAVSIWASYLSASHNGKEDSRKVAIFKKDLFEHLITQSEELSLNEEVSEAVARSFLHLYELAPSVSKNTVFTSIAEYSLAEPVRIGNLYSKFIELTSSRQEEEPPTRESDPRVSHDRPYDGFFDQYEKVLSAVAKGKFDKLMDHDFTCSLLDGCSKGPFSNVYEKVLKSMFNEPKNTRDAVASRYALVQAVLEKDDLDLIEYAFNLCTHKTAVLNSNSSVEDLYWQGFWVQDGPEGDETLQKMLDVNFFVSATTRVFSNDLDYKAHLNRIQNVTDSPGSRAAQQRLQKRSPQRFNDVMKFLSSVNRTLGDKAIGAVDTSQIVPSPVTRIAFGQSPDRRVVNLTNLLLAELAPDPSIYTYVGVDNVPRILTGGGGAFFDAQARLLGEIKETPGETTLLKPAQIRTVARVLRPLSLEGDAEKIREQQALNTALEERIYLEPLRGVSARGFFNQITDPELTKYGYTGVLYERNDLYKGLPETPQLYATLMLGRYHIRVGITEDSKIVDSETNRPISRPPIGCDPVSATWFANVILAHLQEPLCEDPREKGGLVVVNEAGETINPFSRVGHVRVVPRWDFVPNQVQRDLATEENGNGPAWRLLERNAARVAKGLYPVTYVRRVDALSSDEEVEKGPIRFRSQVKMSDLAQKFTKS